jgi:hypothetical protein
VSVSVFAGSNKRLVLVCVNLSTEGQSCDLGFSETAAVYTTSAGKDLERSDQNTSRFTIPARGVATVILEHWRR